MGQRARLVVVLLCTACCCACTGKLSGTPAAADENADIQGVEVGGTAENTPRGTAPPPASLKRLRTFEYLNTIRDLFGPGKVDPAALRPELVRASFSSISATLDCHDAVGIETFETLALEVASSAFSSSPTPLDTEGCRPSSAADPCLRDYLAAYGRRIFRRPLTAQELSKYENLLSELADLYDGDANRAAELTLTALLQSPYFLNRVELGVPRGEDPQALRYTPHEMASRLSYTLWETTPDETLLAAAEAGELTTAESVREHALRMLSDPRSEAALTRFWREHLNVDRLTLTDYPKSSQSFPNFEPALYESMRAEAEHLAERMAQPGVDALSFLDGATAFVDARLAAHYGMPAPTNGPTEQALPPERRGYLTSGLFLSTMSHPDKTSPTRRGQFVLERILCAPVPPPPNDVDVAVPDARDGTATLRDQLTAHREDPACAGCHQLTDPIGFALEAFDATGGYRELDNGLPVDASGELREQPFDNAVAMLEILREDPRLGQCLVRQTLRYMVGQLEESAQRFYLNSLAEKFESSNHDFRALWADIVSSEVFRWAEGRVGDDDAGAAAE